MSTRRFCAGHRSTAARTSRNIATLIPRIVGIFRRELRDPHLPAAKTSGPDRRRNRQVRFAGGKDCEKAIGPLTRAGGLNAIHAAKSEVQQAPLTAVHW